MELSKCVTDAPKRCQSCRTTPATAIAVGKMSIVETMMSDRCPGWITPGQTAAPGIRIPPSNTWPFPPFSRPSTVPERTG